MFLTWCVVREGGGQGRHGGGLPADRGRGRGHGEGCWLTADVGDEHGAGGDGRQQLFEVLLKDEFGVESAAAQQLQECPSGAVDHYLSPRWRGR